MSEYFVNIATEGVWDRELTEKHCIRVGSTTRVSVSKNIVKEVDFNFDKMSLSKVGDNFVFSFGEDKNFARAKIPTVTYYMNKTVPLVKEFREKYVARTTDGRTRIYVKIDTKNKCLVCIN